MRRVNPRLAFAGLAATPLVVAWPSVAWTWWLAWHDDQYTHILLIVPLAACLIFLDWPSIERVWEPAGRAGTTLLCSSMAAFALTRFLLPPAQPNTLFVTMLAIVLWWIGSFVLCFGVRAGRIALFPLAFVFLLAPLPPAVVTEIVGLLQRGSADAAHALFAAAGVPVMQSGITVSIPGLTLEVAQECSSIRSSMMLLVTSLLLAQVVLRSTWRKLLVVALAIPLAVAKNGFRIFVIAMLGTRIDPSFLTGRLHREGGILFFLLSLALVFFALWGLRRGERERFPRASLHAAGT